MLNDELTKAQAIANAYNAALDGVFFKSDPRAVLSAACHFAALEHHTGIIVLIQREIATSAFALLRCLYECHIRGTWLFHCATNEQLANYQEVKDIPRIAELINQLEDKEILLGQHFSNFHAASWSAQNDFTHGGINLISMHITSESIERNFSDDDLRSVLNYAHALASMSAIRVSEIAGDQHRIRQVLEVAEQYLGPTKTNPR